MDGQRVCVLQTVRVQAQQTGWWQKLNSCPKVGVTAGLAPPASGLCGNELYAVGGWVRAGTLNLSPNSLQAVYQ